MMMAVFNRRRSAARAAVPLLLLVAAGSGTAQTRGEPLTVRVLPQVVSAKPHAPFRLGFQTGLLEGSGNPFRAECFAEESLGPDSARVTVKTVPDPDTGRGRQVVVNNDVRPLGVSLTTRPLRRGVGHTVRVSVSRVDGKGTLRLAVAPVGAPPDEAAAERFSVKGAGAAEKAFAFVPQRDGAYRCAFELEPGSALEFRSFSLLPDDAEAGWDHPSLEALRAAAPGSLRWPVVEGLGFYNWYDGVGPHAVRRAVAPTGRTEEGHGFGTAEFVRFCRLIGAEPVIRVTVFQPGVADARVADLAAGARLAADWVAYCNAQGGHPLALLRARHGAAAPFDVKRWELVTPAGGVPEESACRAYAVAMAAEDASVAVGAAPAALAFARDRYVAQVMRRLSAATAAEREYYSAWYDALGTAYAGLERLGRGEGDDVCTAYYPEQVLYRVTYAKHMLAEAGLLMALFNRFPAHVPLVTEGPPEEPGAPFRVQAAWTEGDAALVVFVYNSGPESRTVRLDLSKLRRRFAFWVSDQLAADIASRRASQTVPVNRTQTAGAAVTQWVECEAAPSSFTRLLVKE